MAVNRSHAEALADRLRECADDFELIALSRALAALGTGAALVSPVLARLVAKGKPAPAAAAAFVIAQIGPAALDFAPDLVFTLMDRLSHPDGEVRHWSAVALGRFGPAALPVLPNLAAALSDPDDGVRLASMHALHEIGPEALGAVPELFGALADPEPAVAEAAARTLARVDPGSAESRDRLAGLLADEDPQLALHAALALPILGDPDGRARNRLAGLLEHIHPDIRLLATDFIGQTPVPDERTALALGRRLADASHKVRYAAVQALARFGPRALPATEALAAALDDPEDQFRHDCLAVMDQILPESGDLRAFLLGTFAASLDDPCPFVQARAARTLLGQRALAPALLDRICALTRHPDTSLRRAVLEAMGGRSAPEGPVFDTVRAALADPSPGVRVSACQALGALGVDPAQCLPVLAEVLNGNDPQVQVAAIQALGALGPKAMPVLGALEEKQVASSLLQDLAREAIRRIQEEESPADPGFIGS